jgi:hypothetical protein
MNQSEALAVIRNWQNAAIEVGALIVIASGEIVIEFAGRTMVAADSITITNDIGEECRIALQSTMTFSYADSLLKIDGAGWGCNLYESKDKNLVRLASESTYTDKRLVKRRRARLVRALGDEGGWPAQ